MILLILTNSDTVIRGSIDSSDKEYPQDPYLWLEDLSSEKTREFVESEDLRAREFVKEYSNKLYHRLLNLYTEPAVYNFKTSLVGYYYIYRDKTYYIKRIYRDRTEEIVFDANIVGRDIIVPVFYVSRKGDLLAVYLSEAGRDEGRALIIDTSTKEIIDEIRGDIRNIIFLSDQKIYYTKFFRKDKCPDGTPPPCERVFIRGEKDEEVFGSGIFTGYFIGIKDSLVTDKILGVISEGWTRTWLLTGDIRDPSKWRVIHGGDVINTPIEYIDSERILFVKYDQNGMGRILVLERDNVYELVKESSEYLSNAFLLRDKLGVVYISRNCSSYIKIYDLSGRLIKEVSFDKPLTIQNISEEIDLSGAILETTTFTQRIRVLRYDSLRDMFETIYSSREVSDVSIEDKWVVSHDGTKIHYFVVKKRDADEKKVLAYGYGGFSIALTPMYYPWAIPFIEDGGVFVVANLRGGSEYGEEWHRAGMREKKINVFRDFIAVIEDLRRRGSEVVAMGGSNGGLLVAATMIMKPDLLKAAVIGYPILDMLRFHLLYIGRVWVSEYGDPDNPGDRVFLLSYSPYHNIRGDVRYPPTYIYTGLHDDRVHPAHAFKFHSKLIEYGNESYLRVERAAGHLGALPEVQARQMSDVMGFIYKILGIEPRSQ